MTRLLQPQEIEVFYIIPSLKKHLAISMKSNGLKQNKIAELLQIETASVSQYINNKRGSQVELSEQTLNEISKSALVVNDKLSLLREIQRLLRVVKMDGTLCKVHKQISPVPQECNNELISCFTGER